MHLSAKQKKRILLLVIGPALTLLIFVGLLYFVAVVRFKEGLKYIVNRESKGRYAFNAGEATLSLWNKSILLRESELYCPDNTRSDTSYRIKIHELYFSLGSTWRDLVFRKKIIADSLSIVEPDIIIPFHQRDSTKESVAFRPADLLNYLEKTLEHFNVHSFTLKDAAFTYTSPNGLPPLHGDHINLTLQNFTGVNDEDSHLLGSDKVILSLGPQHWVLPDGKHEISFKGLDFSSKGQRFEIDSFSFSQKTVPDGEIKIQGDKFFLTSQHLPAIYQKDELLLDTLTCINPLLTVVNLGKEEKLKISDSAAVQKLHLSDNLFKLISIRFINVIDGALTVQKGIRAQSTATHKANLSIYNLVLDPAKDPALHTDSFRINLRNIEFVTKDSLFHLAIAEFSIRSNDVLFRNVVFGPTSLNRSDKGVMFTAPSLLLKDISIPDLLQKRLKAAGAELYRPEIVLYSKPGAKPTRADGSRPGKSTAGTKAGPATSTAKLALFYQTLHGMSELIDTRHFHVTEGVAHYQLKGVKPLEVTVKGLNVHILLNQLFVSDSLVDIKHSIPDLRVGDFNLITGGLRVHVQDYRLNGVKRDNWGDQLQVSTANGMELKGSGIYWRHFDWDIYQQTRAIQIDSLYIDQLDVHATRKTAAASAHPDKHPDSLREIAAGKDLPLIRIGRLTVNKIGFTKEAVNGPLHFNAGDLKADNITSQQRLFAWNHVRMKILPLTINGKNSRLSIDAIDFDNEQETVLHQVRFESEGKAGIQLSLPMIRTKVILRSSDLSQLSIPSLTAGNALLHYTATSGKAPLTVNGAIGIQASDIRRLKNKEQLARYGEIRLDLTNIDLNQGTLKGKLPEATVQLSDGTISRNETGKPSLTTALQLVWKNASFLYNKDSTAVAADRFSGSFADRNFVLAPPVRLNWQQLIAKTTVREGSLHYKGKKVTAEAADYSWNPSGNILTLTGFSVVPNESRELTFQKAPWQNDYMIVKGSSIQASGIQLHRSSGDSSIHISKLVLDGLALDASRDKNIPFHHGIEKPMPTKLINAIPFPVKADTVLLHHSSVVYNELSASTRKWSSIPFENLDGAILNISNRNNQRDTLKIFATAELFNSLIRSFSYEESYGDSLSGFAVRSHLSPIDLTAFSQVSVPMAAVSVTNGRADTLYSNWEGNMYATTGTMNFYYNHLKIRVLNKDDPKRRNFLPVLKTWVANLILPDSRKRASAIFVERDREKFIFNYWVKAMSSGALSTVGIKKNKTYRKNYLKKYKQYSLPGKSMDGWKK